jgi:Phage integrase family
MRSCSVRIIAEQCGFSDFTGLVEAVGRDVFVHFMRALIWTDRLMSLSMLATLGPEKHGPGPTADRDRHVATFLQIGCIRELCRALRALRQAGIGTAHPDTTGNCIRWLSEVIDLGENVVGPFRNAAALHVDKTTIARGLDVELQRVATDMATPLVPVLRGKLARHNAPATRKVVAFAPGATELEPVRTEPGPWLFYPSLAAEPTPKDEARLYKAVRRAMTRVLRAAGLPGHFTPHSLRHSFGSLLIAAGESPAYVQQQMGHASIQMTVDVYGSWLPVRAAGAMDRLAASTSPDGDRMVTSEASEARAAVSRQKA